MAVWVRTPCVRRDVMRCGIIPCRLPMRYLAVYRHCSCMRAVAEPQCVCGMLRNILHHHHMLHVFYLNVQVHHVCPEEADGVHAVGRCGLFVSTQ